MTSIPASRSARQITLAPRSWPSKPGLATRTLIFLAGISSSLTRQGSKCHRLLVFAVDIFQRIHHFSQRGVGLDALEQIGHQVIIIPGGLLEVRESPLHRGLPPVPLDGPQPGQLLPGHSLIDLQERDRLALPLSAAHPDTALA